MPASTTNDMAKSTSAGRTEAIGIAESVQDDHMRSRIGQVRYLGELLVDWGIPIMLPVGGHAIFLDAKRFYPHLAQDQRLPSGAS